MSGSPLHDLRAAGAAIRRLDPGQVNPCDMAALERLREMIDSHGEALAMAVSAAENAARAKSAAGQGERQRASAAAIDATVEFTKAAGVDALVAEEAIRRTADELGVEAPEILCHAPRSRADMDESRDMGATKGGRSFAYALLANVIEILPVGPLAHAVMRAQAVALRLASQGRGPWPDVVKRERVAADSGRESAWGLYIARQAGRIQAAYAASSGKLLAVEDCIALARADADIDAPPGFSESGLLQSIKKRRGAPAKAFDLGRQEFRAALELDPEAVELMREIAAAK